MSFPKVSMLIVAALAGLVVTGSQARAAFIVTLQEVGPNVVAIGTGTIDTAALTLSPTPPGSVKRASVLIPLTAASGFGPTASTVASLWTQTAGGSFPGPATYGSGLVLNPTSGSGDVVSLFPSSDDMYLPSGYSSGTALSDTDTFAGSFSSLGLTPGSYSWTWGTGATADSYTLNVVSAVPEPASLAVIGIPAAMGLLRRRRPTI